MLTHAPRETYYFRPGGSEARPLVGVAVVVDAKMKELEPVKQQQRGIGSNSAVIGQLAVACSAAEHQLTVLLL